MRSAYKLAVVVFLLAGLMTGRLYGQGGATGAIIGVVVDTTGQALPTPKYKSLTAAPKRWPESSLRVLTVLSLPLCCPGHVLHRRKQIGILASES